MRQFTRIAMFSLNVSFVCLYHMNPNAIDVGRGGGANLNGGGVDWKNLNHLCKKLASIGVLGEQLRIHIKSSIL